MSARASKRRCVAESPGKDAAVSDNKKAKVADAGSAKEAKFVLSAEHLKSLDVRRIVRENHLAPITQASFCRFDPEFENILGTVGSVQANIYDNEHCGEFLDPMCQFVNGDCDDADNSNFDLTCGRWMRGVRARKGEEDAHFCVAGKSGTVQVISVIHTAVSLKLEGHDGPVFDLAVHPTEHDLLLSVGKDKMILWSVLGEGSQVCQIAWQGKSATFSPDGKRVFVGGSSGEIRCWDMPDTKELKKAREGNIGCIQLSMKSPGATKLPKKNHDGVIDCIRMIKDGAYVVSKSMDGRMFVTHSRTGDIKFGKALKVVPHPTTPCQFDISPCEKFLAVGTDEASILIFSLETGERVTVLSYVRARSTVRSTVFSRDGRSIVSCDDSGFIWRWDHVKSATTDEKPQ